MKSTTITTGKVRLSYFNGFVPKAAPGATTEQYGTSILIPKSDEKTVNLIKEAINDAKIAGLAKLGFTDIKKVPVTMKQPLRDGDLEKPGDPLYEGMYFLNANNKKKPGIVDRNRQAILDPDAIWSGCYARVNLTFYAFAVEGNKGVAAALNHIQLIAEGEALDGRISADEAFGDDEDFDDMDGMV